MASVANGVAFLDRVRGQVIDGDAIDWNSYLQPDERSRIVAAETLLQKGKDRLCLEPSLEPGLTLPWGKSEGKVLIRPGKLCVWSGWTHHGKTAALKQINLHAIRSGEKCLVASMEEEVVDVWADMAVMGCAKETPSPRELERFADFIMGKLWLYDQQGSVSARRIQAVIRYAAKELGVTQAVVDSLMMLQVDRDDYDAQKRFMTELKATAKDTGVTIHLVAHMRKRDGKGGDDSIGTVHDIAGGHDIGSIADYIFIVWRDKRKDRPAHEPSAILRVDKQRGRINWTGNFGLNFHQSSRQFVEEHYPMSFYD